MQFKVPQDVLRPDKIVGALTIRQLIIVTLGGGMAYSLYVILSRQYFLEIWLPPVAFVGLLTMAFAFIRFHDIVFEKLCLLFIEYKFKPRARIWQKMQGDVPISVLSTLARKTEGKARQLDPLSAQDRRKKLEEIMKVVDTHGKRFTPENKSPITHS